MIYQIFLISDQSLVRLF